MLEGLNPSSAEMTAVARPQQTAALPHVDNHESRQADGRQVTRRVEELRPHPSFARQRLNVPFAALSVAASQADLGFREPIVITHDKIILKGYAQWQLAGLQGRERLPCIEYTLSEEEALYWLLQSHRRSHVLIDFARIVLALDLEPLLHEKGRSNQRTGGHDKGSSILAKADRVDVRSQMAAAAAVSSGNITKVKQLLPLIHPEVREALQLGQLSIHRAWQWRNLTLEEQAQRLFQHQSATGVRRTIRKLVSQHLANEVGPVLALPELLGWLQKVDGGCLRTIQVAVVDSPGYGIMVSKALFHAIDDQKELPLYEIPATAETDSY